MSQDDGNVIKGSFSHLFWLFLHTFIRSIPINHGGIKLLSSLWLGLSFPKTCIYYHCNIRASFNIPRKLNTFSASDHFL